MYCTRAIVILSLNEIYVNVRRFLSILNDLEISTVPDDIGSSIQKGVKSSNK